MFPTWPGKFKKKTTNYHNMELLFLILAKSEGGQKKKDSEPKAPEAGKMYEQLVHQEFALQLPIATGFHLK